MNTLPISSNIAPKPGNGKIDNNEVRQQDAQNFGNVLARQVADQPQSASAKKPSNSGNNNSTDDDKTKTQPSASDTTAENPVANLPAAVLTGLIPPSQQANSTSIQDKGLQQRLQPTLQVDALEQAININKPAPDDQNIADILKGSDLLQKNVLPGMAKPELEHDQVAGTLPSKPATGNGRISAEASKIADAFKLSDKIDLSAQNGKLATVNQTASEITTNSMFPGLMQSSHNTLQTSATPVVSTPINHPAWADDFGQKVTWIATQQNQSAQLHLNPPQLGPLEVNISMNGDQATATFTSPHAAVREAIENALPKLREQLAENGITLGQAMVSDQPSRQQEQNAQKARGALQESQPADLNVTQETRMAVTRQQKGIVDTFA